jgi:hypothetical protein
MKTIRSGFQKASPRKPRGQAPPTPAIKLWWQEAVTFCEELGKQDSRTYRLPGGLGAGSANPVAGYRPGNLPLNFNTRFL